MRARELAAFVALGLCAALWEGCLAVYVHPKTYRCASINAEERKTLRSAAGQLNLCAGMTRNELENEFERTRTNVDVESSEAILAKVRLVHSSADTSFLVFEGCRVRRFVFERGRLVESGVAVMEMGLWYFTPQRLDECGSEAVAPES